MIALRSDPLIDTLIDFSTKHEKIYAIYKGSPPDAETKEEAKHVYYYLLYADSFDWGLADDIGLLVMNENINLRETYLMEWPCSPEDVKHYPNLETLIWEKPQKVSQ